MSRRFFHKRYLFFFPGLDTIMLADWWHVLGKGACSSSIFRAILLSSLFRRQTMCSAQLQHNAAMLHGIICTNSGPPRFPWSLVGQTERETVRSEESQSYPLVSACSLTNPKRLLLLATQRFCTKHNQSLHFLLSLAPLSKTTARPHQARRIFHFTLR